jgi:hypothetical protein
MSAQFMYLFIFNLLRVSQSYLCPICLKKKKILIERVDIEQYMSAMTYKPNVLRFWMKMR